MDALYLRKVRSLANAEFGKPLRHRRRLAPITLIDCLEEELLRFGIGLKRLVALRCQDGHWGALRQLAIELDAAADDLS